MSEIEAAYSGDATDENLVGPPWWAVEDSNGNSDDNIRAMNTAQWEWLKVAVVARMAIAATWPQIQSPEMS